MQTLGKHPHGATIELRLTASPISTKHSEAIKRFGSFTACRGQDSTRFVKLRLSAKAVALADELIAAYGLSRDWEKDARCSIALDLPRVGRQWMGKHRTAANAVQAVRSVARTMHTMGKLKHVKKVDERRADYLEMLRSNLESAKQTVKDLEQELAQAEADSYRCARPAGVPQHLIGRV